MSNSVTAAKRRRAGPLLTSPLFQAPNSNRTAPPNPPNQTYNPNVQTQQSRPTVSQPVEQSSPRGLTLQQVISQLDTRLLFLEQFVIDSKAATNLKPAIVKDVVVSNDVLATATEDNISITDIENIVKQLLDEHMSEFSHRYDLLAAEILSLKFIVMKLQTYTLDVNKALMDERIHILSDLGDNVSQVENTGADSMTDQTAENTDQTIEPTDETMENTDQNAENPDQNNITTEIVEPNINDQNINDNYEKTANALAQLGIFLPAQ